MPNESTKSRIVSAFLKSNKNIAQSKEDLDTYLPCMVLTTCLRFKKYIAIHLKIVIFFIVHQES